MSPREERNSILDVITFLIRGCLQSSKPIAHVHLLMYLTNPLPCVQTAIFNWRRCFITCRRDCFPFSHKGNKWLGDGQQVEEDTHLCTGWGGELLAHCHASNSSYWRPHRSWKENELRDERLGPVLAPPLGDLGQVIESLWVLVSSSIKWL